MRDKQFATAIRALKAGHVIAYPTEAVWGLGCDPLNADAVASILAIKKRPQKKGLILVASELAQLGDLQALLQPEQLARITQPSDRPTTWLIPHAGLLPEWIVGEHSTVAIRISTHPIVISLCDRFGGMLVSTSANPAGLPPAENEDQARHYFGAKISAYVSGATGESEQPSAIIDLQTGRQLR